MPPVELIQATVKAGAEALTRAFPAAGRMLEDVFPATFSSDGRLDQSIFRQALRIAPDDVVREQLMGLLETSSRLNSSQLENIGLPAGRLYNPVRTDLVASDGTKSSGYLRILGGKYDNQERRLRVDIPTQFISANLFDTVPKSALRESSFSAEMFAEPRKFEVTKQALQEVGSAHYNYYGGRAIPIPMEFWDGRSVKFLVTEDAGKSAKDIFGGRHAQSSPAFCSRSQ